MKAYDYKNFKLYELNNDERVPRLNKKPTTSVKIESVGQLLKHSDLIG